MIDAAINSLLVDAGCFERGCACYDARDQVPPVPMVKQKAWVGLTQKDKEDFLLQDFGGSRLDAMDWADKRLKEKNT